MLTAEEWEAQRRSLLAAEEEAERAKEREKEAARESKDSGTIVVGKCDGRNRTETGVRRREEKGGEE